MNIYDFDDTIYSGDTFRDLLKYSLVRHPFITINSLFRGLVLINKYKKGLISFERVKETLLSFMFKIKNKEEYINKFINSKLHKIKKWYKDYQKDDDIIISASYELWIKPFCNKIGIKNVIATKTDKEGNIIGKNCKSEEKVRRLYEEYPNIIVNNAYSDSSADIPMLEIAKQAYIVEGDRLIKYEKGYNFKINR